MSLLTETMDFPHLSELDLRPSHPGECVFYAPRGQAFEIGEDPQKLQEFLAACDGTKSRAALLANTDRPDDYAGLLDLLAEEGCLGGNDPNQVPAKIKLAVSGTSDLCDLFGALLSGGDLPRMKPIEQVAQLFQDSSAPFDLLVILLPYMDEVTFKEVDHLCYQANQPWVSLHFEGEACVIGPWIVPGSTSDYQDVLGRRKCSGNHIEKAQLIRPLLAEEGAPCPPPQPDRLQQITYMAKFIQMISAGLQEESHLLRSTEMLLQSDGRQSLHTILPLPTRVSDHWHAQQRSPREMVVDHRLGIVLSQKRVPHHPTIPSSLLTVRTHCTDLSQIYEWGNDLFVGGSSFYDPKPAEGASLGEALERYCGNCLPGVSSIKASYNELIQQGRHALDPDQIVLHSKRMLATKGCPFVPFTRDLQVRWVEGRSLSRAQSCLLPLSMVYANWCSGEFAEEPITHYLYTPGMAAGVNLEHALVGALRELIERDITMIWWLNAHALEAVEPTPELEALWANTEEAECQRVKYIHLDNPFGIPVIVAIVENTRHQFLNIGFGCRSHPIEAAKKALSEALTLQEGSRDLLGENSMLRKSANEWGLLTVPYKPWRNDRAYMDSFRKDFRDINDLMLQQQFYLDPRAVEHIRFLLDTPVTRTFDQLPTLADDSLNTYVEKIHAQGFEILYADITSPDVDLTGYKVVRALIPGLVPNMPAAFPAVGGPRVTQVPLDLGWRQSPLKEEDLNMFPMPHA